MKISFKMFHHKIVTEALKYFKLLREILFLYSHIFQILLDLKVKNDNGEN